jgi:hypothetical protein
MALTNSGPIVSKRDGQVIQNFNITATDQPGIIVRHNNVLVYNNVIRHGATGPDKQSQGILVEGVANPEIWRNDIAQRLSSLNGPNSVSVNTDNILIDGAFADSAHPSARGVVQPTVHGVRVQRGSRLIKATQCPDGVHFFSIEGHRVCGLDETVSPDDYGGNFIQLDNCPGSLIEDFSYEDADSNGTAGSSWTEDLVSIFHSDDVTVQRGFAQRANGPTGDNFINEGSLNCRFIDCDAPAYANGAFAFTDGGDGQLVNCRAKNGSLQGFDNRGAPSSGGLMIAVNGPGTVKIVKFQYWNPADPNNLLYEATFAPNAELIALSSNFTTRSAIRVGIPS